MPEVVGIDHVYLSVADLEVSASFYDRVLRDVLGFRKNAFSLGAERHIQYFNRSFGIVLRPGRRPLRHDPYAPGLHHLCLRVDSAADVHATVAQLRELGIGATDAQLYLEYAPDYVATFLEDPDGIRLEVTNYRQERRDRHDHWGDGSTAAG